MLQIVILAAGLGKRMASSLPKVLHPLAGRPMLLHVIDRALQLNPQQIVIVVGYGSDVVQQTVAASFAEETAQKRIVFAHQPSPNGTGHALQCALPQLHDQGHTLVLYGDVPLITQATLSALCAQFLSNHALTLLVDHTEAPFGYGRIVRNAAGQVTHIVEEKDADATQKLIKEVNTGFMVIPSAKLATYLSQLTANNAQGEYYLTDFVQLAVADGQTINTLAAAHAWEVLGVNNKLQLAKLERIWQYYQAEQLLNAGVSILDPNRIDIRGNLSCAEDVEIDVGCIFIGDVVLGAGVRVGPYSFIRNAQIGAGTTIAAMCHIDGCQVGGSSIIGPYARLRPETVLADNVHVGNFVEIKKSTLATGSKANHLSYLGDCTIGKDVNVGAGTITCNYDGVNKYQTIIEDGVFIGSDTQLVAPVRVGAGATVGAGTTVTEDVPPRALALSRTRQAHIQNWQAKKKAGSDNKS